MPTHQLIALSIEELCRIRDDELVTDLSCNEINIILNELVLINYVSHIPPILSLHCVCTHKILYMS